MNEYHGALDTKQIEFSNATKNCDRSCPSEDKSTLEGGEISKLKSVSKFLIPA